MLQHHVRRLVTSTPIGQSLNRGPRGATADLRYAVRYFRCSRFRRAEATSSTKPSMTSQNRTDGEKIPQWLLIYHASRTQIALLGAAKIFAFAWFGFAAAVLAPTFYEIGAASSEAPELRYVFPAAILAASSLPLYVTMVSPRAFVTYVHIALPAAARGSRNALAVWARRIPATTRVVVTSQRASLNARQTETCMAELSFAPAKLRAGAKVETLPGAPISRKGDIEVRLERKRLTGWQPPVSSARTNWFVREPRRFIIRVVGNESKEKMVWDHFVKQMGQQTV